MSINGKTEENLNDILKNKDDSYTFVIDHTGKVATSTFNRTHFNSGMSGDDSRAIVCQFARVYVDGQEHVIARTYRYVEKESFIDDFIAALDCEIVATEVGNDIGKCAGKFINITQAMAQELNITDFDTAQEAAKNHMDRLIELRDVQVNAKKNVNSYVLKM
jgi:hypothetical protein